MPDMPVGVGDEAREAKLERRAALIALICFGVGIFFRYMYIFRWHPMLDYIFSDMMLYSNAVDTSLNPKWIADINDTVFPPGTKVFFRTLKLLDPSMDLAMTIQFLLACATPILIGLMAAKLFARRTGWYACAMASLYFPLFDLNGYLLSEGPFIFFLLLAAWFFTAGITAARPRSPRTLACALAAGIFLGIAASFKSVALPAGAFVLAGLVIMVWRHKLPLRRFIAAGVVGLLLVLVPLSVRATRLSEGRFCLIANELSRSVLLGHFGNIHHVNFQDARRDYYYVFGCPTGNQHGYTREVTLPVGVYENGPILAEAWTWTKAHPITSFMLSVEHIFELFFTSECWPSYDRPLMQHWVILFHELFIVFILFPAVLYLLSRRREMLRLDPGAAAEIFLTLPVLALAVSAFISIGEARYRVPFDAFLIILAARFFSRRAPARAPLVQAVETRVSVAPAPAPEAEALASTRGIPSQC